MSSSDGTLPFLEILCFSATDPMGRRTWDGPGPAQCTTAALLCCKHKAILEQPKATKMLPFNYLPFEHDICPRVFREGAKIYSFWVGFLDKKNA